MICVLPKNVYTILTSFRFVKENALVCFLFYQTVAIYFCLGYIATTFAPLIWCSKCEMSASEYCLCFTSIGSSSNWTASMPYIFHKVGSRTMTYIVGFFDCNRHNLMELNGAAAILANTSLGTSGSGHSIKAAKKSVEASNDSSSPSLSL